MKNTHKRLSIIMIAMAIIAISISSCKKDDDDDNSGSGAAPLTNLQKIVGKKWYINNATMDGMAIISSTDECGFDDYYIFHQDSTVVYSPGDSLCYDDDEGYTDQWYFSADEDSILFNFDGKILELSNTTLRVEHTYEEGQVFVDEYKTTPRTSEASEDFQNLIGTWILTDYTITFADGVDWITFESLECVSDASTQFFANGTFTTDTGVPDCSDGITGITTGAGDYEFYDNDSLDIIQYLFNDESQDQYFYVESITSTELKTQREADDGLTEHYTYTKQ